MCISRVHFCLFLFPLLHIMRKKNISDYLMAVGVREQNRAIFLPFYFFLNVYEYFFLVCLLSPDSKTIEIS